MNKEESLKLKELFRPGPIRQVWGGGWACTARRAREENRYGNASGFRFVDLGFRLVRDL